MDSLHDLRVIDLAQVGRGDHEVGVLDVWVDWQLVWELVMGRVGSG